MTLGSPTRRQGPRTVTIPPDWEPSPENINALPGPLREYCHDLHVTKPADLVQASWELRRTNAALRARIRSLDAAPPEPPTESTKLLDKWVRIITRARV